MKSAVLFALAVALPAGAQTFQDPYEPRTPEEYALYDRVERAIYREVPEQKERFELDFARRDQPVFYSDSPDRFEQVQCENVAAFRFIGHANELGAIAVAICRDGARVRKLARYSRAALDRTFQQLRANGADLRTAGLEYAEGSLADGAEFYSFPLIFISHGFLIPWSAVIYDPKTAGAVVVQADAEHMCGRSFPGEYDKASFCADMRGALKRIAQAVRGA